MTFNTYNDHSFLTTESQRLNIFSLERINAIHGNGAHAEAIVTHVRSSEHRLKIAHQCTPLIHLRAHLRYHVPLGRHEPCVYHQSAWPQRADVAID